MVKPGFERQMPEVAEIQRFGLLVVKPLDAELVFIEMLSLARLER